MKKYLIIIAFFSLPVLSSGQSVQLISVDQLNVRVSSGKDTVYVVNFWATWCKPCIKELPYFIRLDSAYGKDKLQVLLVSVDFPSAENKTLVPFLKKMQITKNVYIIEEKNQQAYIDKVDPNWSGAIPATLFIKGSKRKLVEQSLAYSELLQHYQNIQQ